MSTASATSPPASAPSAPEPSASMDPRDSDGWADLAQQLLLNGDRDGARDAVRNGLRLEVTHARLGGLVRRLRAFSRSRNRRYADLVNSKKLTLAERAALCIRPNAFSYL